MPTNRHGTDWMRSDVGTAERLNLMKNVGLPPGSVAAIESDQVPTGWLLCDGRDLSRTIYADLFAAIGTRFGAGDGSTTFGLPDLRGRFLRGRPSGGTLGDTGGSDTHLLTVGELPAHTHTLPAHTHSFNDRWWPWSPNQTRAHTGFVGTSDARTGNTALNTAERTTGSADPGLSSVGADEAHNNMPAYLQVDWMISL